MEDLLIGSNQALASKEVLIKTQPYKERLFNCIRGADYEVLKP
jgi:hypothetical protein